MSSTWSEFSKGALSGVVVQLDVAGPQAEPDVDAVRDVAAPDGEQRSAHRAGSLRKLLG